MVPPSVTTAEQKGNLIADPEGTVWYTQMRTMLLEYAHLHNWAMFGVSM